MTEVPYVYGPMRREILAHIAANPGCTSLDIANAIDRKHFNVGTALGILTKRGVVARQRDGTHFRYMLPQAYKPIKPRTKPVEPDLFTISDNAKVTEAEAMIERLADRVTKLVEVVKDLTAWKAAAIAKHPDLAPADPLLLKAREIAAQISTNNRNHVMASRVLEGAYDNTDVVQAALAALRGVAA